MGETYKEDTTSARGLQAPKIADLLEEATDLSQRRNGAGGQEAAQPPPKFTPFPADDLDKLPPLQWHIKGEIVRQGFGGIYAAPATGKTTVMLDRAFTVGQEAPVIYVAAEGAPGYAARKLAWCKYHGKGPGQVWFVGEAVNLLDMNEVAAFIVAVKPLAPVLIVFDTLARCMIGGDENSAQSMGLAIAACDEIRRAIGAAVYVVHHSGKAAGVERGSSALRAAADVWLSLTNEDGAITLTAEKIKDGTPFEPRGLRLVTLETGRLMDDGTPETACVILPGDLVVMTGTITPGGRRILETLNLETFKEAGAKAVTLMDILGMKHALLYKTLSALRREDYVKQHERGDPFYITAKGELALEGKA